jgi:hypothetical protein
VLQVVVLMEVEDSHQLLLAEMEHGVFASI